ncbi:sugar transferase [Nocardioides mangrovicus]|uniref:Sugar transferase n=1 Tax=Nocardioides mangrovicus TaxID=2478913 RepID=A0A3L8NYQ9_9ACTN|nr:sugar transferase [Nocardioides mangrovicus]
MLSSGAASSRVLLPLICLGLDLGLVLVAILAATGLRQSLPFLDGAQDVGVLVDSITGPIVVGWLAMLGLFGTYRSHALAAGTEAYRGVVNASIVFAGFVGIACYLFKVELSRGFFVMAFVIGIPLLVAGRLALRRGVHAARRRGLLRHRVLVAGDSAHIDEIATIMARESWLGYGVVGALRAHGQSDLEATATGVPYVGDAAEAADTALRVRADAIIVAGGAFRSSVELRRAQWALEDQHVAIIVAPSVTDVARERVAIRPVAGLPLVHVERPQGQAASRWAKRVFDLLGAGLLVLLLSPLLVFAAIVVKRHDGGPVLFRQVRVGRDGQRFAMLKFRSMVVDAEARLAELSAANQSDGLLFKVADDPRITAPGRWLRRYSVDELPQLFNVLRGDMSLVGPRPALPDEVSRYDTDVSRRLRVRPGITGLWQVSGRSDLSWEDTVRLDLYYVDNWSMLQDLLILARTVKAVVGSDGAY